MQREKIAAIVLVIIVVGSLSAWFAYAYYPEIFENLFEGEKPIQTIEWGDLADVHYIGRYASNGTIFESSYEFPENKTGGFPLNFFVNLNSSENPPDDYSSYSNLVDMDYVEGFIEGLVGLKTLENGTIGPLTPEKAYGISPQLDDVIDLSLFAQMDYTLRIIELKENVPVPEDYQPFIGNGTTTLLAMRLDMFKIGDVVDTYFELYPSWDNSSVVTKINETTLWYYTTPPYEIGEDFSWVNAEAEPGQFVMYTAYPENTTQIISMNESTIILTHTPAINSTIEVSGGFTGSAFFTVEAVTADIINASIEDDSGNKTYQNFNRTTPIQRNDSQNITIPEIPADLFEWQFWQPLRSLDPTFKISFSPMRDQTVIFEVDIIDVYKAS